MMMGAYEAGVDMSDEAALERYMYQLNSRMLAAQGPPPATPRPVRKDTLAKLGLNQRISVRYTDGRVVDGIKFKKVESDLREGRCTLL